ncbi:MAG: hypothetical protein AVDCRST_MAG85-1846, partial [uncultured Solirubrobacteraceae bacterium]
ARRHHPVHRGPLGAARRRGRPSGHERRAARPRRGTVAARVRDGLAWGARGAGDRRVGGARGPRAQLARDGHRRADAGGRGARRPRRRRRGAARGAGRGGVRPPDEPRDTRAERADRARLDRRPRPPLHQELRRRDRPVGLEGRAADHPLVLPPRRHGGRAARRLRCARPPAAQGQPRDPRPRRHRLRGRPADDVDQPRDRHRLRDRRQAPAVVARGRRPAARPRRHRGDDDRAARRRAQGTAARSL